LCLLLTPEDLFLGAKSSRYRMPDLVLAPKGLEGVVVTNTTISKIDGNKGKLTYRGYDISDLAEKLSFEETAYLLWYGRRPAPRELSGFKEKIASERRFPAKIKGFVQKAPASTGPLAFLRTTTSLIGMYEKENEKPIKSATYLLPKFPMILSAFDRHRKHHEIISPKKNLSFAENYLLMLSGKVPNKEISSALNSYLILLADHGLNSSTFSAIVTISTLTDYYSAITSAIGTLKGPLHGGAPSQVWQMLTEIGSKARAEKWLQERIDSDGRIMGFGHRVYRTEDPRSKVLKSIAKKIAKPEVFELADFVEATAREMLRKKQPERVLDTNVEFYSSLVLNAVGIPTDMFTATFACSRLVGWTAHILEQLSDNRLFRPESEYVGPEGLILT
jgi:citrate synthase